MRSLSIQSRPLSLRLRHLCSPKKRLWGANDWPRTTTSSSTCGTDSQRSPGNFTRQPFTYLCRSGTSASPARANTSDIQVLVSVPRPPARFFLNAPHMKHGILYSIIMKTLSQLQGPFISVPRQQSWNMGSISRLKWDHCCGREVKSLSLRIRFPISSVPYNFLRFDVKLIMYSTVSELSLFRSVVDLCA